MVRPRAVRPLVLNGRWQGAHWCPDMPACLPNCAPHLLQPWPLFCCSAHTVAPSRSATVCPKGLNPGKAIAKVKQIVETGKVV